MSETFTGETDVTERCLVSEFGKWRVAGNRTTYQYAESQCHEYPFYNKVAVLARTKWAVVKARVTGLKASPPVVPWG